MPKNLFQLDGTTITERRTLDFVSGTGIAVTFVDDGDSGAIQFDLSSVLTVSRGGTLYAVSGLVTGATLVVWRAPFAGTVTKVWGYRNGGSGATINAQVAGSDLLASDLSLTGADTWMDGGAVQNTAVAVGNPLAIEVATVAGSPTYVSVQVDLTRSL